MNKKVQIISLFIFMIALTFGSFSGQQAQVTAAQHDGERTVETQRAGCSAWERGYRVTQECVDGNQTLITTYDRRYCPGTGWEIVKHYEFVNGCIAM